jgi:thiol:disulfide interchange protein
MTRRLSIAIAIVTVIGLGTSIALGAEAIYDENANASQLIAAAIADASRSNKNIVLDFGANWCYDCHVLASDMESGDLAPIVERNFVVVKINVGRFDKNLDLARKYHVPLKYGIPALAVLDSHGKLLYAQDHGQFEDARHMKPQAFKAFFEKWKPRR